MPKLRMYLCLFGFALLGFQTSSVCAQGREHVVYLKNGSVVRGELLRQVPMQEVEMVVADGTHFTFATTEIDSICLETKRFTRIRFYGYPALTPYYYHSRGLYRWVSLTTGWSASDVPMGGFDAGIGYQFHRMLRVGIQSGLHNYTKGTIMPLALELRGTLLKKPVSPHYFLMGGYGAGVSRAWQVTTFRGGAYAHAGAGLAFHTRSRNEWLFSAGIRVQDTFQEFTEPIFWWGPWTGNPPDPIVVKGTRLYLRTTLQITLFL
ncbi:MAG: hypothetical protein EAZ89_11680 [Bacteroidetes bacterium]|nr:MAG: hypothetical protein EAZ89_11680 [Bacteroidota bacterium]